MIRAHGDWLAFLATVLERERVITGEELARSLSEYAAHTAADNPAEGHILAIWASYLHDASVTHRQPPAVH